MFPLHHLESEKESTEKASVLNTTENMWHLGIKIQKEQFTHK